MLALTEIPQVPELLEAVGRVYRQLLALGPGRHDISAIFAKARGHFPGRE